MDKTYTTDESIYDNLDDHLIAPNNSKNLLIFGKNDELTKERI